MKRRNKWLKAMSIALSCAMLATNVPMNVLATEVVIEETQESVAETELVNEETQENVAETESINKEVQETVLETQIVEEETQESVAETELVNQEMQESIVETEVADEENVTQAESVNETEGNSELEDDQNIIANDETGIPDKAFYELVLGRADGNKDGVLTKEEASELKYLNVWSASDISNIKGIKYCTKLDQFSIGYTQVTDISELSNLTNLTYLGLDNNQITDISALKDLTNLERLELSNNQITDISVLKDLTNLESLDLSYNQITDISVLKGLTNLRSLNLSNNQITDISALTNLTNLTSLTLENIQITNISALKDLTNLGSLDLSNNQITDISALKDLTNLGSLDLSYNQITDITPLADLIYNVDCNLRGNNITTGLQESVIYDEEVDIRYLTEPDRQRVMEILGLSEYDGKVICMSSERSYDSFQKFSWGDGGSGFNADVLRTDNGGLALGYNPVVGDGGFEGFFNCYDFKSESLVIVYESSYKNDYVWLLYYGDADASGLKFTDKVEKTKVVEPFAKKDTDATINKNFEREFGEVLAGTLSEQDVESINDYFGFDYYEGDFAIIPTEGSEYKIDFANSSYGKDELYQINIEYYSLTRNEEGKMLIQYTKRERNLLKNGKLCDDEYEIWYGFLTEGNAGTDIEDCKFYLPAMDKDNDKVTLMMVTLYALDGSSQTNLIVYNDEKTLEVCNFTNVEEPKQNNSYEVTLPADKTTISASDFATVLQENKTKDVVIKSNNNITFTFAKGTMANVDGIENYDFGTKVVSDFANAGNMGSSVTKDNFVTRINYNYSGKLPATATIKIYVGTDYANQTLYYSKIVEDGFKLIQSVKVDKDGYITVSQDSCSDYVVTINELTTTTPDDTQKPEDNKNDDTTTSSPDTSDQNNIVTYMTMLICGVGALFVAMQKKRLNK